MGHGSSIRCVWLSDDREGILRGRVRNHCRDVDSAHNQVKAISQVVNSHRRRNVGTQTWNKQAAASFAVNHCSTYLGDRESYAETRRAT
jgi:hypothetical protein